MIQILITQAEVQNHNALQGMLVNPQQMDVNGVPSVYTEISQSDLGSIQQSLDVDAWAIVKLPKEIVEN